MDGITGFNPTELDKQIATLMDCHLSFCLSFSSARLTYFNSLTKTWCSQKAVEFSKEFFLDFENCFIDVSNAFYALADKMQAAYNAMATANGAPTIDKYTDEGAEEHATESEFVLKPESESGDVGMNKQQVQYATDFFVEDVNSIIEHLNDMPVNISLFDPDGSMQATYNATVKTMTDEITALLNVLNGKLNTSIETEIENVTLGVNQSVSILSSNIS